MTMLIPLRDRNPYDRFPLVTVALIAANIYVYFKTAGSVLGSPGNAEVFRWGAVPCDVLGNCPEVSAELGRLLPDRLPSAATLLTSMFMHGGFLHLGGNMLYLWVFGNNIEDRLGHVGYLLFYLVTGFVAAGAHLALNMGSAVPIVGASGAVSGVLGAYIVLWPHARIVSIVPLGFFFFTVEVPAGILLGIWFLLQILGGLAVGPEQGGGVAFAAHVGGFVAGWILIRVVGGRRRRRGQGSPD